MSFELRPYQEKIIAETRDLMRRGVKAILIQSPTGSGKTALTAKMLETAAARAMDSWFICHRRELVKQSIRTFHATGLKAGIIAAGFPPEARQPIQIASIQTLARRHHLYRRPKLVVWDEAHHVAAGSWSKIHAALPGAFHIGLTATPERLDGAGLDKWFSAMVRGPSVSCLIEDGFLAPYKMYAPAGISVESVKVRMGDFAQEDLAKAVDKPTITGDAIRHYQQFADGKRAVVFAVSIEHSKHVVAQFGAAGIPAAHVDGETDVEQRDEAIRAFEAGRIRVLSNVELFGEGFDLPAIEAAILLRPTQSLGLYLQQCGRVLRPCPGKPHAVILDHAGNCKRHGLPDEDRIWSLVGHQARKKSTEGAAPAVRICPRCLAANFVGAPACKECGHVFPAQPREVKHVDGQLEEVDPETLRRERLREQGKFETFDELVELGRRRGYRRPHLWAKYLLNARQARKLGRV